MACLVKMMKKGKRVALKNVTHDDDLVTLPKGQRERIKQKELLVTPNKINIKKSPSTPGTMNGNLTNNGTPIRKYLRLANSRTCLIFVRGNL